MPVIDFNRGRWSESTRSCYEIFWRDFETFCKQHDTTGLEAKPQIVADFLTARSATLSTSSLSGRLAAIVAVRALYRKPLRIKETMIRDAWAEIRRRKGIANTPKMALPRDALVSILSNVDRFQDRAILLVGFKSAMRRSELVALDYEDLAFSADGLGITIRHSKTDKMGKGQTVTIARTNTDFCAVAALEAWLQYAEITSGAVFRSKNGRMPKRVVADITKKWAAKAGFDPRRIGAHSLRSGCITTMQEAKVDLRAGMLHSRHVTPAIYLGYAQVKQGLDSAAVKALA